MAPEVMLQEEYDEKADVYRYGLSGSSSLACGNTLNCTSHLAQFWSRTLGDIDGARSVPAPQGLHHVRQSDRGRGREATNTRRLPLPSQHSHRYVPGLMSV